MSFCRLLHVAENRIGVEKTRQLETLLTIRHSESIVTSTKKLYTVDVDTFFTTDYIQQPGYIKSYENGIKHDGFQIGETEIGETSELERFWPVDSRGI